MSWQKKGHCWMKGLWETRPKAVQQEREEVYAAMQHAASFHCLVEQRKDFEDSGRTVESSLLKRSVMKQRIKRGGVRKLTGIDV